MNVVGYDSRDSILWKVSQLTALVGFLVVLQGATCGVECVQVGEKANCTCSNGEEGVRICSEDNTWGKCNCSQGGTSERGNDSGSLKFSQVDAGKNHACGVLKSNGRVRCWGANNEGQTSPPSGTFKMVSAGDKTTCGIEISEQGKDVGQIECWGARGYQEFRGPLESVSVGDYEVCGINANTNNVACSNTELPVGSSHAYERVSLEGKRGCWRNQQGDADCEEFDDFIEDVTLPDGKYADVDAGYDYACGVLIGEAASITCVGQGKSTQIPDKHRDVRFDEVSVGKRTTCGLEAVGGAARCWGEATTGVTDTPDWAFESISVGVGFACGLTTTGEIVCWGNNDAGQATPPSGGGETMADAGGMGGTDTGDHGGSDTGVADAGPGEADGGAKMCTEWCPDDGYTLQCESNLREDGEIPPGGRGIPKCHEDCTVDTDQIPECPDDQSAPGGGTLVYKGVCVNSGCDCKTPRETEVQCR